MLHYDTEQVVESLALASNPNSALKSFLKQEIQKGDPVAKFVKALKNVLAKRDQSQLAEFVESYHEKYQPAFFVISRYVHNQALSEIASAVIEQYADEFNQSYTPEGESIDITDRATFERIVTAVLGELNAGLAERDLPQSAFMKNLLIDWIFDEAVALEVYKIAEGES